MKKLKFTLFLYLAFFISIYSATADYISSDACSDMEKWVITGVTSDLLRTSLSLPNSKPSEYTDNFINEFSVFEEIRKQSQEGSHQAAAADYLIARHFFRAHLFHIAQKGFLKILTGYSNTQSTGIKVGALECLTKIYSLYPSIHFSNPKIYQSFLEIPYQELKPAQKTAMRTAAVIFLKSGLAKEEDILPMFNANTAESHIGNALLALIKDQPDRIISSLKKYKQVQTKSDFSLSQEDWLNLIMGRAYFELGKFKDAASAFDNVANDSNYLPESMVNKAWSYLQAGNYPYAIGSAYGVLKGSLSKTFQPEAIQISSIIYLELCQAEKSRQQFNFYEKLYAPSHQWLGEWLQSHAEMRQKSSYQLAVDFKKNGDSIPARIGLEWWRTPGLLSAQREINLVFEERAKYKEIISSPQFKESKSKTALTITMKSFLKQAIQIEKNAVATANLELEATSKNLLESLNQLKSTLDLIEAEALSISTQLAVTKKIKGRKIASKDSNHTNWNWGKRGKNSNDEVWEDELDALQGDLKNYCK